jgi:protease I
MLGLLAAGPAALALFARNGVAGQRQKKDKQARKTRKSGPKVLMPVGDGTEVVDTLYPFFRLAEEGFDVVVCGPEARLYHMVTHEVPPNSDVPWDITQEGPGYHIQADIAFADIDPDDYAGMFISGGRAPEYLRYDQDLMRVTRHLYAAKKPLAVVCHGIEIVAAAGVLKGRRATTVGKCELDITQTGGTYVDQPLVVDGNLISCGTWHDYGTPFMKTFIRQLRAGSRSKKAEPQTSRKSASQRSKKTS